MLTNVRVARPTNRLDEVVRFYRDGLGLPELGSFTGHAGYDGVMLGLPGEELHLELTNHPGGGRVEAPTRDNLLVLYFDGPAEVDRLVERLARLGHAPVEPENPYWRKDGVTIEDPDGWRVVLVRRRWE